MATSSPCPFVLAFLIWICPHLLRRNRTLIPMFSSLQIRNGTHKMSMTNIMLLTCTSLMMISNIQTTTLVVLMFMVTLFHLPVNTTSTWFKSAVIRVRADEPDFSTPPMQEFDWAETVCGKVQEEIPKDIPEPQGKPVVYVHYVDANLYHNIITGSLVTGILHFCNQTLIELFSKHQACVQTATFGSEFVAASIAVDQIVVCGILCVTLESQSRNGASSLEAAKLW
jgi:hypothetical protein